MVFFTGFDPPFLPPKRVLPNEREGREWCPSEELNPDLPLTRRLHRRNASRARSLFAASNTGPAPYERAALPTEPTSKTMDGRSVAHRASETEARGPSNSGRSRCQTASMPRGHRSHTTTRAPGHAWNSIVLVLILRTIWSLLADLRRRDGPAPVSLVLPHALVRAVVSCNPISSRTT